MGAWIVKVSLLSGRSCCMVVLAGADGRANLSWTTRNFIFRSCQKLSLEAVCLKHAYGPQPFKLLFGPTLFDATDHERFSPSWPGSPQLGKVIEYQLVATCTADQPQS
mmetsp:Transcript_55982/g.103555  ORF Transcript_55982/g.103555 Transcript_55982/m.103555 type:complete len:108 (+) Transcript_55982:629-952(+)